MRLGAAGSRSQPLDRDGPVEVCRRSRVVRFVLLPLRRVTTAFSIFSVAMIAAAS
jgi:hypothetical protein